MFVIHKNVTNNESVDSRKRKAMQSKNRDALFFYMTRSKRALAVPYLYMLMTIFFLSKRIPYPREERRGNLFGSPKSSGRSRWELFCLQEDEATLRKVRV